MKKKKKGGLGQIWAQPDIVTGLGFPAGLSPRRQALFLKPVLPPSHSLVILTPWCGWMLTTSCSEPRVARYTTLPCTSLRDSACVLLSWDLCGLHFSRCLTMVPRSGGVSPASQFRKMHSGCKQRRTPNHNASHHPRPTPNFLAAGERPQRELAAKPSRVKT